MVVDVYASCCVVAFRWGPADGQGEDGGGVGIACCDTTDGRHFCDEPATVIRNGKAFCKRHDRASRFRHAKRGNPGCPT